MKIKIYFHAKKKSVLQDHHIQYKKIKFFLSKCTVLALSTRQQPLSPAILLVNSWLRYLFQTMGPLCFSLKIIITNLDKRNQTLSHSTRNPSTLQNNHSLSLECSQSCSIDNRKQTFSKENLFLFYFFMICPKINIFQCTISNSLIQPFVLLCPSYF